MNLEALLDHLYEHPGEWIKVQGTKRREVIDLEMRKPDNDGHLIEIKDMNGKTEFQTESIMLKIFRNATWSLV